MKDRRARRLASTVLIFSVLLGCHGTSRPLHYLGDATLDYYIDRATEIAYPDVDEPTADEVKLGDAPRRIRHPRKDEIWDMPLA